MPGYTPIKTNYDQCVIYANGDVKCYCNPFTYKPEDANKTLLTTLKKQLPSKFNENFEGIIQVPKTTPGLDEERCIQICENCRECKRKHEGRQYKCKSCSDCDVCSGILVTKYHERRSYPTIEYRLF
jgi:hypothetical protein